MFRHRMRGQFCEEKNKKRRIIRLFFCFVFYLAILRRGYGGICRRGGKSAICDVIMSAQERKRKENDEDEFDDYSTEAHICQNPLNLLVFEAMEKRKGRNGKTGSRNGNDRKRMDTTT